MSGRDGRLYPRCGESLSWTHKQTPHRGGDPNQLFVMGHSAGAQLAAILSTDERYLKAEGVPLKAIKGCVPVDGDTYDIPAIIVTAESRWHAHNQPRAKYGHREKFGNDPAKHKDFLAVTEVVKGNDIPVFLLMYVIGHPDVSAQASRFATVLKAAGLPATLYGGRETAHNQLNADIGKSDDPGTKDFITLVEEALKK